MNPFDQYSDRIIKPGLERIIFFLNRLGNPQNSFSTILVGGTNGKGSTVTFLFHMLSALGVKVGGFLSPHLFKIDERVLLSVSGVGDLPEIFREVERLSLEWGIELSPFELLTASVFILFNNCGIDIAVLEVGMGGRWDATNVTSPIISIITSLGLDHTLYLGPTISSIAMEKLPIARRGRPLVLGSIPLEGLKVLREGGKSMGTLIFEWGKDFYTMGMEGKGFCYIGEKVIPRIALTMGGSHQWINASLALKTVELLSLPITGDALKSLSKAWLLGRIQTVEVNGVQLVLDVAHNPQAFRTLIKELRNRFPNRPVWAFLRLLKDKPWREILKMAEGNFEEIYFLEIKEEDGRGVTPNSMKREVPGSSLSLTKEGEKLLERAKEAGAVLVFTGSFGAVREALDWLDGRKSL